MTKTYRGKSSIFVDYLNCEAFANCLLSHGNMSLLRSQKLYQLPPRGQKKSVTCTNEVLYGTTVVVLRITVRWSPFINGKIWSETNAQPAPGAKKSTTAALKASALPHIKRQHRAPPGKSIQTRRSFTSCHGLVLRVKLCWHKRRTHYLYAMHCPTPLCKYRAALLDAGAPVCTHASVRSWLQAARLCTRLHFILSFWVCRKFTCRSPSMLLWTRGQACVWICAFECNCSQQTRTFGTITADEGHQQCL